VTILIERMRQELIRRNYAATTIHSYIKAVEHFQQHISVPLDDVGPDDIRNYHAYLIGEDLSANRALLHKNQPSRRSCEYDSRSVALRRPNSADAVERERLSRDLEVGNSRSLH
jgi:site-specific recombinase XerD